MLLLLLGIIYLAFISLGLPDSLLGSAWPSMYEGLGVSMESAGIISVIISVGTVISSLGSARVIRKLGTGLTTSFSVLMTAFALVGFSFSKSFAWLCVFAVPMGLGAGSVDAALNNFVALHYKAKHMSWLHCFWGIGASLGPVVISFCLVRQQSWNAGYRVIGIFQLALSALLLISLPLWRKAQASKSKNEETKGRISSIRRLIGLPGAWQALSTFFCYCGIESTAGLWGSSYLVTVRGISAEVAASWISLYFFGITFGRFLSGFLAIKLRHKQMVQFGQILLAAGIIVLFLPLHEYFALAGLFITGLGLAPIYPNLIHETPINFGSEYSGSMIGLQMACAYVGTTFIPFLFGLIGASVGYSLLPVFLGALTLLMIFTVRGLYKKSG
ncbi:MAG TPA: MFS transporter [Ruminococcaceae bacterium]|nr:MFS transporter [Oscillospiraceae bacterium]